MSNFDKSFSAWFSGFTVGIVLLFCLFGLIWLDRHIWYCISAHTCTANAPTNTNDRWGFTK